jgi:hypothetical protein
MRLFVFLLGLVVLSVSASATHAKWRKYANARFGFVLSYPATLMASREADNGDGREFHTADKEFSVSAFAHFFVPETDDTFERRWQEEFDTPNVSINYKKKTENWYVVSGTTKDGTEYYHKRYRQGSNWAAFHITYPHAEASKYNPWVAEIEKRFVPFQKGDFDRIEPES